MNETEVVLERKNKEKAKNEEPKMYKVFLLNDDFTTFDHVINVLMTIFQKNYFEAAQITMQIHESGKGLAGTYIRDIAKSKAKKVESCSRQAGYPLRTEVVE